MKPSLTPSPREAYQLAWYSSCERIMEAMKIADYCDEVTAHETDRRWAYMKKMHAVFVAGYVAGMREVRRRKRERGQ